jgi:hypothetical protein
LLKNGSKNATRDGKNWSAGKEEKRGKMKGGRKEGTTNLHGSVATALWHGAPLGWFET